MEFSYKYSEGVVLKYNTNYQFLVTCLNMMMSLNRATIHSKSIDNMKSSPKCTINATIDGDEKIIVVTANGISVK